MSARAPMLMVQAVDTALADRIEAIMWAQVTMAVVMVLCAIGILAASIAVWLLARRALRDLEETRDRLLPHVTPLFDRVGAIAEDVSGMTSEVRGEAGDVRNAVRDFVERSRDAADSVEERVRRFGVVLDVVQEQAQEILLDVASAANGVHAAARALREETGGVPQSPDRDAAGSKPKERDSR